MKREEIIELIKAERIRQVEIAHSGDTNAFDKTNTKNDWIAYVNAYIGRAADKCFRNERENQDYKENMIKAAALIVAALEAEE